MKLRVRWSVISFIGLIAATMVASDQEVDPADDPRNIYRPCPNFDLDCIRNYFWENSECEMSQGPVPEPLFLKYFKVDIANVNLTSELYNVNVKGLNDNSQITEFYINTETDKLVLAVEVCDLEVCSPKTLTKYFRKAKESISRLFHVDFKYHKLTFTAEFRNSCNLNLTCADIFTYVDDPHPAYNLGPSVSYPADSIPHEQYQMLFAGISADLQEVFVREGAVIMASYIQYNICDFGVDVAKAKSPECS